MHFTCESCKASLNIADDKVKGKRLVVRCKRCNSRIQIADPALGMAAILLSGHEGQAGAGASRPAARPAPASGRDPFGNQAGSAGRAPGLARPGPAPAPRPSVSRRDLDPEPFDDSDIESTRAMDSEVLEKALRASKAAEGTAASPSRPGAARQAPSPRGEARQAPAGQPASRQASTPQPAAARTASLAARGRAAPEELDPAASASDAGASDEVPWFAMIGGKQEGPLSRESLEACAASGVLSPRTYVWTEGMPGWVRAREVPDLAALFEGPVPQPALQPAAPPPSAAPRAPAAATAPERPRDARHLAPEEEAQPLLELDDYDPAAEHDELEPLGLEQPAAAPLSPGSPPLASAAPVETAGPAAKADPAQARASGPGEEEPLELDEAASAGTAGLPRAAAPDPAGDEPRSSAAPAGFDEGGPEFAGRARTSVEDADAARAGDAGPAQDADAASDGDAGPRQDAHATREEAHDTRQDAHDPREEARDPREEARDAAAESPAGGAPDADLLAERSAPQAPEELEPPAAAPEEELQADPGQREQAAFGFGMDQSAGSRARPLLFAGSAVIAAAAILLVFASRPGPKRQAEPAKAHDSAAPAGGQPGGGATAGLSVVEAPVVHATPDAAPARGESAGRGAGESPLTAEDVRRKLDQNKPALQSCIDEALRRGPRDPALHAGRIRINTRIAPTGAVSGAKIDKDVVDESKLGACLKDATRRIVFPSFSGAPVDVEIPIDVRAGN